MRSLRYLSPLPPDPIGTRRGSPLPPDPPVMALGGSPLPPDSGRVPGALGERRSDGEESATAR
ncbi:MAG TPA: hypothetical protein VMC83_09785 [Streptosporangiaceae bacterium]|nr:hypothetical protein [Streptosporangiaceae bacterium]